MANWEIILFGVAIIAAIRTFTDYKIKQYKRKRTYWIREALGELGKTLDFSLASLRKLDEFLDENIEEYTLLPNGEGNKARSYKLFCLGRYLGEIIIREIKGSHWVAHPSTIGKNVIKLPDGVIIRPLGMVLRRVFYGPKESLYSYTRGLLHGV